MLGAASGWYAIWVDYSRVEQYTSDVEKGHRTYEELPPQEQNKRLKYFSDEPNIVAKANRIAWCHGALASVLTITLLYVMVTVLVSGLRARVGGV